VDVVNAKGVLRVWRDVVGHRTDAGEYLVVSGEAGIKGEHLTMHLATSNQRSLSVRVVDSRPTIIEGSVRHQLRLLPVERETLAPPRTTSIADVEGE